MKYLLFLFSCILPFFGNAQEIFKYEKRADSTGIHNHTEISFYNEVEKTYLSGTLIGPDNYQKIAVIIPGSGKDTRHSHYILAERLLDNGIAVFRFDERGIGKSGGKYSELAKGLSQDLYFAFHHLSKNYSDKKVGFIGHSLGGIAALAALESGAAADFLVLIETPVIKNGAFVLNQIKSNYENSIPEVMKKGKTKDEILNFLQSYFDVISRDSLSKSDIRKFIAKSGFNKKFIALMDDEFLMEMLHKNLEQTMKNISVPTLYLTGTVDNVIDHKAETYLVENFNNKYIAIKTFDGLNHWLTKRNAAVGSSLYDMDQEAIETIIQWLK